MKPNSVAAKLVRVDGRRAAGTIQGADWHGTDVNVIDEDDDDQEMDMIDEDYAAEHNYRVY